MRNQTESVETVILPSGILGIEIEADGMRWREYHRKWKKVQYAMRVLDDPGSDDL